MTFTHLEVHSHFTLLGATPSVAELAARAREGRADPSGAHRHQCALRRRDLCPRLFLAEIEPVIGMTLAVRGPDLPSPLPEKQTPAPANSSCWPPAPPATVRCAGSPR